MKHPRLRNHAIVEHPSPNFDDRKGTKITLLIQHYTAMATAQDALQRLCDPAAKVSSHYLVAEDGTIYHLVDDDKRAWHAGVSYWEDVTDLNSSSIGIEIANPGNVPYPKAQMDAVAALSRSLMRRYNIVPRHVLGHSDIAPARKEDPGQLFDWQGLANDGIGVWPQPLKSDYDRSANWSSDELKRQLNSYGYTAQPELSVVVTAFQRHFQQDVFKTPQQVGVADAETRARLACLLRRKAAGFRGRNQ